MLRRRLRRDRACSGSGSESLSESDRNELAVGGRVLLALDAPLRGASRNADVFGEGVVTGGDLLFFVMVRAVGLPMVAVLRTDALGLTPSDDAGMRIWTGLV